MYVKGSEDCPSGYQMIGSKCYHLDAETTWVKGRSICESMAIEHGYMGDLAVFDDYGSDYLHIINFMEKNRKNLSIQPKIRLIKLPGLGIELGTLNLVLSTLPLDRWELKVNRVSFFSFFSSRYNVPGSIPGPGTWKIFIIKTVVDGWALQVNMTKINWISKQ